MHGPLWTTAPLRLAALLLHPHCLKVSASDPAIGSFSSSSLATHNVGVTSMFFLYGILQFGSCGFVGMQCESCHYRQQAVVLRTALPFKCFPISDFKNSWAVYYLLKEKLRWMITFSFGFWIRDKILWDSFVPRIDPSHFWFIFIFINSSFLWLLACLPLRMGFCCCCFFLSCVLF